MSVPTCDHLKEDGVFCGSPAMKGRNYCYFHLNLRGRRLKAARARRRGDNPALNLPFPEDMHAVQVSLAEILWALAERRIEHKDAGLMLYALQQASTNLNHTPGWQGKREAVPSSRPLRAINYPDFEKRFGLPGDTDLEADPDAAVLDDVPAVGNRGDNAGVASGPQLPIANCGDKAGMSGLVVAETEVGCSVQAELDRDFRRVARAPHPYRRILAIEPALSLSKGWEWPVLRPPLSHRNPAALSTAFPFPRTG